jgi:2-oxoglutarate ferredoxin oxidoreductase subunit alpha
MGERLLMKGNEVIAEAAIRAGCRSYFGYPITPQSEIANYMAKRMPQVGGTFLQAESEVAAINMVFGAGSTGIRTMTSSSSPGMALKQEGISYIAGAEIPAVVVNIVRAGPGLGGIHAAQSDYFMSTRGGGHGDYRHLALAPSSVQEMYELTVSAFDIADQYRTLVLICADGILGQMMEVVDFKTEEKTSTYDKSWALTGTNLKRPANVVTSVQIIPEDLEKHNIHLQEKYDLIKQKEVRYETIDCEDADLVIVSYGSVSRIVSSVVNQARKEGFKVGLLRPITLWPFPEKAIQKYASVAKAFLAVELSSGQMVEDVRLYAEGSIPVHFFGRNGGMIPSQSEIYDKIKEIYQSLN